MKFDNTNSIFEPVRGSTIALVYIFEGEDAPGFAHYDIWRSDVISEWMNAVQELGCMPFIVDVRTFILKAISNTMPKVDFIVNLNAGAAEVSALGLVPIIASFLGIPCIPCDTITNLTAEHKQITNLIAKAIDMPMAAELDHSVPGGVFRPVNYGSSKGMQRSWPQDSYTNGIYQEFVPGYDITTPILYNPLSEKLELLPTIMYCPPDLNPNWMFDAQVKARRGGYFKKVVSVDKQTNQQYLKLVKCLEVYSFCRIDARVKCSSSDEWNDLINNPIDYKRIYFLEVNATPTIKPKINFLDAIDSISEGDSFYEAYRLYRESNCAATHTGFLLACSMLAAIKAKHYGKTG